MIGLSIFGFNNVRNEIKENYGISRNMEYNMLKIDMYAKEGRPVLMYLSNNQLDWYASGVLGTYLNYINTKYYTPKAMDFTETIKTDYAVKPIDANAPIDNNAIYISDVDLIKQDPRFKDFRCLGQWGYLYSFIHKSKLE
jgi:hypothetical protein